MERRGKKKEKRRKKKQTKKKNTGKIKLLSCLFFIYVNWYLELVMLQFGLFSYIEGHQSVQGNLGSVGMEEWSYCKVFSQSQEYLLNLLKWMRVLNPTLASPKQWCMCCGMVDVLEVTLLLLYTCWRHW